MSTNPDNRTASQPRLVGGRLWPGAGGTGSPSSCPNWRRGTIEVVTEKRCSACGEVKPLSEFTKRVDRPGKYRGGCRPCRKARDQSREKERGKRLRVEKYGLTAEEYQVLWNTQAGRCAICDRHEDELTKRLAVDHCHNTGTVRGLLCDLCNLGIGLSWNDSPELLLSCRRPATWFPPKHPRKNLRGEG